jgi:hypothetical protein
MFGFTLNVVVCDYKNQRMKYQVLHLQTIEDELDKYLKRLKKPNATDAYPRMMTDSNQIKARIDNNKIYQIYFNRDDIKIHKHKKKESFYDYVFSKLFMEVQEDNLYEYSELKFDEKYFQKKESGTVSQFTIDLNIHIKDSIQSKLRYLE